jgi:cysteinyl-tRNA synthetase
MPESSLQELTACFACHTRLARASCANPAPFCIACSGDDLIQVRIEELKAARATKHFEQADFIRKELTDARIKVYIGIDGDILWRRA